MVVVAYDVNTETPAGRSRLRRVAKQCMKYGQRVQNSVFECVVESANFVELKHALLKIIQKDSDSLRFYHLGTRYSSKIEYFGIQRHLPVDEVMLI